MRIAYVNYGNQSGVTPNVVRSLSVLGHRIVPVDPTGILALRDPRTRLPRPTPRVLLSLAASALRHGPQLIHHRLNTAYAFDQHSRRAGELLEALAEPPDIVLQNGALFAPGRPPRFPYPAPRQHQFVGGAPAAGGGSGDGASHRVRDGLARTRARHVPPSCGDRHVLRAGTTVAHPRLRHRALACAGGRRGSKRVAQWRASAR